MSRRRFFASARSGQQAWIRGPEVHHLRSVLRVAPGQQYELAVDGDVFLATVDAVDGQAIRFALGEPVPARERTISIRLCPSIFKFDRFEWLLEKATELGVTEIQPLITRRTEAHLAAAAIKRTERWRKLLLQAAQQSRQAAAPALLDPQTWKQFLAAQPEQNTGRVRLFLSEFSGAPLLRDVVSPVEANQWELIAGPEGGWTEDEAAAASQAGLLPVSLGPHILRAETAGIAALAALNCLLS